MIAAFRVKGWTIHVRNRFGGKSSMSTVNFNLLSVQRNIFEKNRRCSQSALKRADVPVTMPP